MILRWWRKTKAPYEHWCLIRLKSTGTWEYLADVGLGNFKKGLRWFAAVARPLGTSGAVLRTSHSPAKYPHLHQAMRAAEALVLGNVTRSRIKRATWPAVYFGEWNYPPRIVRGRQLARVDLVKRKAQADILRHPHNYLRDMRFNRVDVENLRASGQLLALPSAQGLLYPKFQLKNDQSLYREVAAINLKLDAKSDPWGVASWWLSPHGRLGDSSPASLLGTERSNQINTLAEVINDDGY